MDTRVLIAVGGLAVGLAISVAAWVLWETLLLFVLLPFIPLFALRGTRSTTDETHVCPACGFQTTNPEFDYCPRDGHRLEPTSKA